MVGVMTLWQQASEVPDRPVVVGGVDTHKNTHHAAVLTATGTLLADAAFPATAAGYIALHGWLAGHGVIEAVGVEQTGSYGAGLTRHLTAAGLLVLEVTTTDKATRARRGKDDRTDAIAAASKVLAGMATATPKDTTGTTEALRVLLTTRQSAVGDRTAAINQLRGLLVTAPEPLRDRLRGLTRARLLAAIEAMPAPAPTTLGDPGAASLFALKRLTARIRLLDGEVHDLDKPLQQLTQQLVPTVMAQPQVGPVTAARLAITVADNIDRLRSEAAFARLTGVAPIPVSSGNTHRMRLHRGGDRQANSAIHLITVGRLKHHQPSKDYIAKKLTEHKSKKDAIRSLKRLVARSLFTALKHDLLTP